MIMAFVVCDAQCDLTVAAVNCICRLLFFPLSLLLSVVYELALARNLSALFGQCAQIIIIDAMGNNDNGDDDDNNNSILYIHILFEANTHFNKMYTAF